jgi:hypothetical protein
MRLPRLRLTVRWMVAVVAVIALDFGLIREAYERDLREPCMPSILAQAAFIFVPSLSILLVAAVQAGLGVARGGCASPFASGYLLLGGLASLGVCLDIAARTHLLTYLLHVAEGLLDPSIAPGAPETLVTSPRHSIFDGWVGDFLLYATYVFPQFAFGIIGGGLANLHGLAIVMRSRETPPGSQ